jgi:hypothetical protein
MGGAIVVWIVSSFIFFIILYNVIRHALDNSKLINEVEEIKELLNTLKNGNDHTNKINKKSIENIEECPACKEQVKINTKFCPSCGLKLEE